LYPVDIICGDVIFLLFHQVSRGLWKKYGDKRIIDTPITEVSSVIAAIPPAEQITVKMSVFNLVKTREL